MVTKYRDDSGVWHKEGDRAYCYYTMKPGTVGEELDREAGWFEFYYDDGTSDMLNGQRICSIEHAQLMGWPDATLVKPKPPTPVKCGVKVFTR